MKRLALFLITILCFGCGDDDGTNPTPPVPGNAACFEAGADCEIQPLAVGNTWTYEYRLYNLDDSLISVDTSDMQIVRDTVIGSETWYLDPPAKYINRDDGLWAGEINYGEAKGIYLYPGQPGDTFYCNVCSYPKDLLSISDTVTIGLGTYLCYKYRAQSPTLEWGYTYVAPGVGRVLYEMYFNGDETTGYLQYKETLIGLTLE
ncbi:MAG: hypothetical protein GY841_05270 [FCB group bacterium]|nr:hypothetical protein [FCB group bacterium]